MINLLIPFADQQHIVLPSDVDLGDTRHEHHPIVLGLAIRKSAQGLCTPLRVLLHQCIGLNSVINGNYTGRTHTTLLILAVVSGSLETVHTLMEAGANRSLPALWGTTRNPLQAAVEIGTENIVRYLLQQGADPNESPAPRAGATAFRLAAITGYIGIAAMLMDKGAYMNAKPALLDGRTAFEGATEHGRIDMMLYLVQHGADLHADNQRQFRRAVKFAEKNGQHATKRLTEDLLQSTRKDVEANFSRLEDAELTIFDSTMFDDILM
jgi:ankyrin repeat protein